LTVEILTRFAVQSDLPAISRIYNQAIAENQTGHLDELTAESQQGWFDGHTIDYPLLVADCGGEIVGWSTLSPYRPGREAFRCTAELSYYVDVAYRRQRVASKLIRHSIDLSLDLNIETLLAILLADNEASIALLTKFRFALWASLPELAKFDGRSVDHLYYGLRVS
jgi:L-amino acid N-acyltransferase YncA